jgi:hypothetical protein
LQVAGIAALLGLMGAFGRRYGANAAYAFVGMAFWLAVFVAVIFAFG